MLVAAVFVVSMIWFMQRTAKSMRGELEAKVAKVTAGGVSKVGLFSLVFLLVLREGAETVFILSAVSMNSTEILSFTGTLLGVAVAVVFGVLFIRGSVKINLQRFFRVTTVVLYLVTFQLVVSGLHELSENGVLPSSTAEMRYIGPIVRSDIFFFVTMLALIALMVLMEQRGAGAGSAARECDGGRPATRGMEPAAGEAVDDGGGVDGVPVYLLVNCRVHLCKELDGAERGGSGNAGGRAGDGPGERDHGRPVASVFSSCRRWQREIAGGAVPAV